MLPVNPRNEGWTNGDFIGAALANEEAVRGAVDELVGEGFSRSDIWIYTGRRGSEELRTIGGEGLGGMLWRVIQDWAGNSKELTYRLETETERGHYVVMVAVPDGTDEDRARRILLSHRAYDVMGRIGGFYKSWVQGGYSAA